MTTPSLTTKTKKRTVRERTNDNRKNDHVLSLLHSAQFKTAKKTRRYRNFRFDGWQYNPRKRVPRKVIHAVAQQIAERFLVEKILLFGSYAHGRPTEGSDVDYLVIMNHDLPTNRKMMLNICESFYPKPFPMDIIVRTPEDIKARIPLGDWFLKDAYSKSQVLYDRTA